MRISPLPGDVRSLRHWSDLSQFAIGSNAGETTLSVFNWAIQTMADFYGDEWFETMANKRRLPFSSIWDRPLTNEIATTIFIERAVRIALLPAALRDDLAAEVRTHCDLNFFDHLDIVLEVAGLALRDGWQPETCPKLASGRTPDLRLTRPGMQYTVEVTTCGLDRETINADAFQRQFLWKILTLEEKCGVELVTEGSAPALDERTEAYLFSQVEDASEAVVSTGVPARSQPLA